MKRPLDFIETDNIVIDVLNDMITNNTSTNDSINDNINKIRKISGLEANLDNMIKRMTRTNFALESKPDNIKKILRVSISYTYHQSDANDRSHFMILIEGHLLDEKVMLLVPFGSFFDRVRVVIDKKINTTMEPFEWSASELPDGHKADCFRFKIYTDKPQAIKIFLHRAEHSSSKKRVELADQLRALLPNMAIDPTEDEVMLAMWEYIDAHRLIDSKGVIKCEGDKDRSFLAIVRQENFHMTTLKQKLQPFLLPCKPIQVDYNLNPTIVPSTATTVAKLPRTFDIEVDIPDPFAFEILNTLNHIVLKQREMEGRHLELYLMSDYIARTIVKQKQVIDDLHCIVEDPLTHATKVSDYIETTVVVNTSKAPVCNSSSSSSGSSASSNSNNNNSSSNSSSTTSSSNNNNSSDGRRIVTLDFSLGEILSNSIDPVLLLSRIGKATGDKVDSRENGSYKDMDEFEKLLVIPYQPSECHSFNHFIDVGDDELFQNEKFLDILLKDSNNQNN